MQCRSIHTNREILLVRPHCGAREPLNDLYLGQYLVTQRLWQLFPNFYSTKSIDRLLSDYSKILSVTIMLKFYASQALPHNGNWQFTYKVTENTQCISPIQFESKQSSMRIPHCPSTFLNINKFSTSAFCDLFKCFFLKEEVESQYLAPVCSSSHG